MRGKIIIWTEILSFKLKSSCRLHTRSAGLVFSGRFICTLATVRQFKLKINQNLNLISNSNKLRTRSGPALYWVGGLSALLPQLDKLNFKHIRSASLVNSSLNFDLNQNIKFKSSFRLHTRSVLALYLVGGLSALLPQLDGAAWTESPPTQIHVHT